MFIQAETEQDTKHDTGELNAPNPFLSLLTI